MNTVEFRKLATAFSAALMLSACGDAVQVTPANIEAAPANIDAAANKDTTENSAPSSSLLVQASANEPASPDEKPRALIPLVAKAEAAQFTTIEWTDLIPKDDLDALLNPPSYVTEVEDNSLEDQISSQLQNTIAAAADDRYQQALVSTKVVAEMDGQATRIPGFIVPLEFDDELSITQFFLVPFFGACIHVPPPPPNQIIFVNYPKGLKDDALYAPFWISGVLKASITENDFGNLGLFHGDVRLRDL